MEHPVVRRRRWWLPPRGVALLGLALLAVAVLAAACRPPPDSWDTVWVSLGPADGPDHREEVGKGAKGGVGVAVERGRVADLGPFAERVAALVAPTAHRSPAEVSENLDGSFNLAGVSLGEPLVPRRVDTQAVQQALAADGFHWLIVSLYVGERSAVLPRSAAAAGGCWGNGSSCEWRIATAGPPLRFALSPP
jgi:hypothetical protein